MTTVADGARILAVETMASKSHRNFVSGTIRALVGRGHHVTAFTSYPDGGCSDATAFCNCTEADTSGALPKKHQFDLNDVPRPYGSRFHLVGPHTPRRAAGSAT